MLSPVTAASATRGASQVKLPCGSSAVGGPVSVLDGKITDSPLEPSGGSPLVRFKALPNGRDVLLMGRIGNSVNVLEDGRTTPTFSPPTQPSHEDFEPPGP